jgi:hypothetical protein
MKNKDENPECLFGRTYAKAWEQTGRRSAVEG